MMRSTCIKVAGRVIEGGRCVSSQPLRVGSRSKTNARASSGVLAGLGAVAVGGALAWQWNQNKQNNQRNISLLNMVHAAQVPAPQPNVVSQTKDHALYLWIHLKPDADPKKVANVLANLQKTVDTVSPPDLRDEDDEVWAGVGFGPKFYQDQLGKKVPENYAYPNRKGAYGNLPSTGGDIFVHAKSNQVSKLYELAQQIQQQLAPFPVERFYDVYSFVFQNGRDFTGFIDGTENSADDESRFNVAVNKKTGGAYCITQRWIHQFDKIRGNSDSNLEGFVGRQKSDSTELKNKPATSHVARMTSGPDFGANKPVEIVRQSMPYGTVGGESGLFFIGFAESPRNFEYMLERMVGADKDGLNDDIMKLTKCVEGTYWYFPSQDELKGLASSGGWF